MVIADRPLHQLVPVYRDPRSDMPVTQFNMKWVTANPVTLAEAIAEEERLSEEMRNDSSVDKLISIALQLEGLYRHASTHAAGVVIADRPLPHLVPVYRDPRSDMPVKPLQLKSDGGLYLDPGDRPALRLPAPDPRSHSSRL